MQIKIAPDLKEILSGMLQYDFKKRTGISELVPYLCKELLNATDLDSTLKQEFQEILLKFTPPINNPLNPIPKPLIFTATTQNEPAPEALPKKESINIKMKRT